MPLQLVEPGVKLAVMVVFASRKVGCGLGCDERCERRALQGDDGYKTRS